MFMPRIPVLGIIIIAATAVVVAICLFFRLKTRYRRIRGSIPWGSFKVECRDSDSRALPPARSGTAPGRLVIGFIILLVLAALVVTTAITWRGMLSNPIVLSYWWIANCTLLFCMIAFFKGRRFNTRPLPPARVAAIVPAFDEDPHELEEVVRSVLDQSVPVTHVYVVDDGSRVPVTPFSHPRVTWLRKKNGGKRSAQVYALDRMNPDDWDYILTADGDSVLDRYALEHQLRAFSTGKVMATTGMVLVRNRPHNLLTRLADLNIGTSCVMMRASRSLLGTLETTSGALALYRAHILFQNKHRYLTSGTYGDDRTLAMYSALEGEVVGVNEAVVWSQMPADWKGTYRQRLRWSKSWWCMIPFVLTNMTRFRQMFFPLFGMLQLAIAPLTIGYIFVYSLFMVAHDAFHPSLLLLYVSVYLVVRYGQTALYMVERPGMQWWRRLAIWAALTPLEAIYNLVFLNPTKYIALVRLGDHRWGTRGRQAAMSRAKKILIAATAGFSITAVCVAIGSSVIAGRLPLALPPPPPHVPVLSGNHPAGDVRFTFDDGPDADTLALISELRAEHVPAVFFVIGYKAAQNPRVIQAMVRNGFRVEVHTWDHKSLTGASTHTAPLTDSQIRAELTRAVDAIVAAGAPRPHLWRPPYGDVNTRDVAIARSLGLQVVMPWSNNGQISDSGDWTGASAATIVRNVTTGWAHERVVHADSIIACHDGIPATAPAMIAAMPRIVAWLNAHHLGATDQIPRDATGGALTGDTGGNTGGG